MCLLRRILREAEGESKFWRSKQRKAGDLEGAAKVWREKAGEPEIAGGKKWRKWKKATKNRSDGTSSDKYSVKPLVTSCKQNSCDGTERWIRCVFWKCKCSVFLLYKQSVGC